MPPRFLYVGACIVVDAEKECSEGIYLRNFREVAFRRSVVAGARRFTISNTFSRSGASKSMRSAALRLRISAIWISVQPWVRSAVSAARARRRWMASRRNSTTCATASRQSFRLIWGGTV